MANFASDPARYVLLPDRINQGYGLVQTQYTDLDGNTSPLAILHDPYNSLAIVYSDTLAGYSTTLNTLSDMAQYDDQGRPTYDHPEQALYASFARQEINKARPVHSHFFSAQTGQSLDYATWAYKSYDQFAKLQCQPDDAPDDSMFITPTDYTFSYSQDGQLYSFRLLFPTDLEPKFTIEVPADYARRHELTRSVNLPLAKANIANFERYVGEMSFAAQAHGQYASGWRDACRRRGGLRSVVRSVQAPA